MAKKIENKANDIIQEEAMMENIRRGLRGLKCSNKELAKGLAIANMALVGYSALMTEVFYDEDEDVIHEIIKLTIKAHIGFMDNLWEKKKRERGSQEKGGAE